MTPTVWAHVWSAKRSSIALLLALCASNCGARQHEPNGGESHFLASCDDTCPGTLDCLSGVCTLECGSRNDCTELHAQASCAANGEAQPVCGVECTRDRDCEALGVDFVCSSEQCRAGSTLAPSPNDATTNPDIGDASNDSTSDLPSSVVSGASPSGGGSSASSANSTASNDDSDVDGDSSSDAGSGVASASCRYAHLEYAHGAEVPAGQCALCWCQEGEIVCDAAPELPCPGLPIPECPAEEVASDPIDFFSYVDGDTLVFEVSHAGGCAPRHDYSVCYVPGFEESIPAQLDLKFVHDAHGNTCEALWTNELRFDLREIRQMYSDTYDRDSDIVVTTFGTYAFGTLTCEDRQLAARSRLYKSIEQLELACLSDYDCVAVPVKTDCFETCDAVASRQQWHNVPGNSIGLIGPELLERELQRVNDAVCSTYADECGEPAVGGLCAGLGLGCEESCDVRPVRCIDSVCQRSDE